MVRDRKTTGWRRAGASASGLILVLAAIGGGAIAVGGLGRRPAYLDLPRATAARLDLQGTVLSRGDVDTAERTIVECELDASPALGGSTSTIIELVDDGAVVEEGQVLARLDSSRYEELVRTQEILLLQAKADERKCRLDLEVAEIALAEYRDGLLPQLREGLRGQVARHEGDIRRQEDRVEWAGEMARLGYLSGGQLRDERMSLQRSEIALARVRGEMSTLDRHSAHAQVMRLEAAIHRIRQELAFQGVRVENREEQLQKSRDQVEACTVRAPHAGTAIYASVYDPSLRIEAGAGVYKGMGLFFLPDLSQIEIVTDIHETMFGRVRAGMAAVVRIEGLPGMLLPAHVKSVQLLPRESKDWRISREVRGFKTIVTIDSDVPGALPGMTAQVEFQAEGRRCAGGADLGPLGRAGPGDCLRRRPRRPGAAGDRGGAGGHRPRGGALGFGRGRGGDPRSGGARSGRGPVRQDRRRGRLVREPLTRRVARAGGVLVGSGASGSPGPQSRCYAQGGPRSRARRSARGSRPEGRPALDSGRVARTPKASDPLERPHR